MARGTVREGIFRLSGGNGHDFRAHEAEDDEGEREPDAHPAHRQEAAVGAEVLEANRAVLMHAGENRHSENDEDDDGAHFDHREPVLEFAEGADAARIHEDHNRGIEDHPRPGGCIWEPPLRVDCRSDRFPADSDRLRRPIGVANSEAGPAREVELGVDAEGAGCGMSNSHLREAAHQQQRDHGRKDVAEDHAWSGHAHRQSAAEEQAGTNGTADRHHGDLTLAQFARQATLVGDNVGVALRRRRVAGG